MLGEEGVHGGDLTLAFRWSLAIADGCHTRPCAVPTGAGEVRVETAWHSKNIPFNPVQPCRGSSAQMHREGNFRGSLSFCSCRSSLCSVGWPSGWVPGGSSKTSASHTSRDLRSLFRPPMYVCLWQEADGPTFLGWLKLQPFIASLGQFRTVGMSKINAGSSGYF